MWLNSGELPEGVTIHAKIWGLGRAPRPEELRHIRLGCPGVVRQYARPNQTLCDYDHGDAVPPMEHIEETAEVLGLQIRSIAMFPTRRGVHMAVTWNRRFSPAEAIALQLILGSDMKRERFNLSRTLTGETDKRWNLLFRRKL